MTEPGPAPWRYCARCGRACARSPFPVRVARERLQRRDSSRSVAPDNEPLLGIVDALLPRDPRLAQPGRGLSAASPDTQHCLGHGQHDSACCPLPSSRVDTRSMSTGSSILRVATVRLTPIWQFVVLPAEPVSSHSAPQNSADPLELLRQPFLALLACDTRHTPCSHFSANLAKYSG